MRPKEKLAKLESLLARVKERADAPRRAGTGAFPAPREHAVTPAYVSPVVTSVEGGLMTPPPAR